MPNKAVILFNLGGPDSLEAVRPFLFNLFSDRAIIRLPNPVRSLLAWWIAKKRTHEAQEIYKNIGGSSPLLRNTQDQADALQKLLGEDYWVTIVMRYWPPRAHEVIQELKVRHIQEAVLLPLYPQFSTSTTQSSFSEFKRIVKRDYPQLKTREIGCYPLGPGIIHGYEKLMRQAMQGKDWQKFRVLFTAHGLPEKFVQGGDPYQYQVEQSVQEIIKQLKIPELDYQTCYQSRVGPLKWIGPSTETEINRAAQDGQNILMVPVSFVSEHSETLYELDQQYAALAQNLGIKEFIRVPALGTSPDYMMYLKELVMQGEKPLSFCKNNFAACGCQGV